MIKFNLQFFADGGDSDDGEATVPDTTGTGDNGGDTSGNEVDLQAFADIISEKDKQIEQLQKDVAELKKSNANLTIMVNSDKSSSGKKSFEENLLNMVGAKPRKE